MRENINSVVSKICEIIDSKKGENIEVFDLSDSDYFVDSVVIATMMADKHSLAVLDELKKELKPLGETFLNVDDEDGNWVVIDLVDIMVHLFTENQRKKFNLEEFLANIKKRELNS